QLLAHVLGLRLRGLCLLVVADGRGSIGGRMVCAGPARRPYGHDPVPGRSAPPDRAHRPAQGAVDGALGRPRSARRLLAAAPRRPCPVRLLAPLPIGGGGTSATSRPLPRRPALEPPRAARLAPWHPGRG